MSAQLNCCFFHFTTPILFGAAKMATIKGKVLTAEQRDVILDFARKILRRSDATAVSTRPDVNRAYIDMNVYLTACVAYELLSILPKGDIAPRVGFIKIKHNGKKFVAPYTWIMTKYGQVIDLSPLLPAGNDTTDVYVKPIIIEGEEIAPELPSAFASEDSAASANAEKKKEKKKSKKRKQLKDAEEQPNPEDTGDAQSSDIVPAAPPEKKEPKYNERYRILLRPPEYYYDNPTCTYILNNESWCNEDHFDMMWTQISSRSKMKEYVRRIDNKNFTKFLRRMRELSERGPVAEK